MTPEYTALVERLESKDPMVVALAGDGAAAAIRALAEEKKVLGIEVAHWKQIDSLRCEELAHTQADRDTLRSEVSTLKEQNVEFLEQARGGLEINHDCPAVFACAYILCELTPQSEQVDDPALAARDKGQFTDGRGNDISHLVKP